MGLVLLPNGEPATPEVESFAVAPILRDATSAVENFYHIRFDSKEAAENWIDQCVVRWEWAIKLIDATPNAEESTWVARAHRTIGAIHDTKAPLYKFESGDAKVKPFLNIVEVMPKCFALTNRH